MNNVNNNMSTNMKIAGSNMKIVGSNMKIAGSNKKFCNNCGMGGHIFFNCLKPITSIGIIGIKFNDILQEYQYLLIQRKDSLGYVDFIRGKYNINNIEYIKNIVNEMTHDEKINIITKEFDVLWNELWGKEILGSKYMHEKTISRDKLQILRSGLIIQGKSVTLKDIVLNSKTNWNEPEWGFPKGRRNYQESDYTTGIREFVEETGIPKNKINLLQNVCQYEETFTGSNFKSYTHKYFLAVIADHNLQNYQQSEVGNIGWYNYEEAIKQIRPYNLEKIDILHKINKVLQEYRLIF